MMTQRQAIIALLVAPAFQKCPFGYESQNAGMKFANVLAQMGEQKQTSLTGLFQCPAAIKASDSTTAASAPSDFTYEDYEDIVDSVVQLYESLPEDIEEGSNPRASFAGCLVRLSGHDFMDFRIHEDGSTTGGSDACINFEDPDNKGLAECIIQF